MWWGLFDVLALTVRSLVSRCRRPIRLGWSPLRLRFRSGLIEALEWADEGGPQPEGASFLELALEFMLLTGTRAPTLNDRGRSWVSPEGPLLSRTCFELAAPLAKAFELPCEFGASSNLAQVGRCK